LFPSERFEKYGPKAVARVAHQAAGVLRRRSVDPAFNALSQGALHGIEQFAKGQERIARLLWQFSPFTADYDYTFRCDHVRAARARLSDEDRAALNWEPEAIDWRQWFLQVHTPALERWVFPEIEKRRRRPPRALRAHETVTAMLEEMSRRHDLEVALQDVEVEGLSRISYRDLRAHSLACAQRLRERGIAAGDRVLLVGDNQSAWAMACFGIWYAGATLVPLASTCDAAELAAVARACGAKLCIADASTALRLRSSVSLPWLDLYEATQPGPWPTWAHSEPRNARTTLPPAAVNRAEDVALLVIRGGHASSFSHTTLCTTLTALAAKFPLSPSDRLLSQLSLSDPFELCGGLLLPLSRGARVAYFDPAVQTLESALHAAHPTVLVGNPSLWQELERRLRTHAQRGAIAAATFEALLNVGRRVNRSGVNLGRLLFGSLHRVLGGELQLLINGDGALPDATYRALTAVGLRVSNAAGPLPDEPVVDDPLLAGHELRQRSSKSFQIN
jgi:long-chain acyl-CoA synthetase